MADPLILASLSPEMAGRAKVLFDLGMLVFLWVGVSSRPEGLPSSVMDMPADIPDSGARFADTYTLADMPDFDSSRAIHTSADADTLADIDPDSSIAIYTSAETDASADANTPADIDPDSSIAIDPSTDTDISTDTDMPADISHLDSSISIDASDKADPIPVMGQNNSRQFLIEDLKKRILTALKLDNAPTETLNDTEFSNDLIQVLQQEKEVTRSDQKENIIVHASNKDHNCLRSKGTHCLKFEFNVTSDLDSVIAVHAWFHKTRMSERLVVRTYSSSSLEDEPLVKLKEAPHKTKNDSSGWVIFELPKTLTFESKGDYLTCTVEIEGAAVETDKEHIPILVLTKHTESQENKRRAKRSSSDSCTCCAENFHVTLEEIGWQNWVHTPTSFNIKMCRGHCSENLSSYTINYQQIISAYYKINKNYPKPKCNFWAPRCEPESYSPLRIVYKHKDGGLHDQEIKDVVIESCRCI